MVQTPYISVPPFLPDCTLDRTELKADAKAGSVYLQKPKPQPKSWVYPRISTRQGRVYRQKKNME